jgi:negative regulator of flagellin synthesis FlgM
MKITNLTQAQQANARPVKDAGAAEKLTPQQSQQQAAGRPEGQQDTVELSSLAKDLQRAAEVARATPEVRAEKVAALKEKIDSGTYEVDSKELASKMIVDSLTRLT